MQRFTGLVGRPRIVVNAQAGLDFATIGEVDATDCRVMALTGHGATQAPQPVHSSRSTSGSGLPPRRGGKRMARTSQKSPQTRHSTPLFGRQAGPMMALTGQGDWPSLRVRARGWQALTQSPQKVQAPRAKSMVGKPPSPATMMCSGQAPRQSLQRVQQSVNSASAKAQGGRISAFGRGRPRKNPRRLASTMPQPPAFILSMPLRSIWSISEPGSTCGSRASQ